MKLNTTKLLIAALALCGVCFLSCEKEEDSFPFEKILSGENTEIEVEVGSFEAAFNVKFHEYDSIKLKECGIAIFSSDSTIVAKYENYRSTFSCSFSNLKPNTTYYYSLFVNEHLFLEYAHYGERKPFTTSDFKLTTCYKSNSKTRRISILGTKVDYKAIKVKPKVDIYFSKRESVLSDDSLPIISSDNFYDFFDVPTSMVDRYQDNNYLPNVEECSEQKYSYQYKLFRVTVDLNEMGEIDSVLFKNLTPKTQYYARAVLSTDKAFKYMGNIVWLATTDYNYIAKPIDLGLSVEWADRNLGTESIGDYGANFAFGETSPKDPNNSGKWETYLCKEDECGTSADPIWSNCKNGDTINISGNTKYDAATAKLGQGWRMPTENEVNELIEKCSVKVENDMIVFTSPNGNSIYFPIEMHIGIYEPLFSLGSFNYNEQPKEMKYLETDIESSDIGSYYRYYPLQIRPVYVRE